MAAIVLISCKIETVSAIGLDISEKALLIAKRNAEVHNVLERLKLRNSNVFSELNGERFDLIVSNPPYIPAIDISVLQPEVRDFEPLHALTDGGNGFSIIEHLVNEAPKFLKPNGWLLIEIGIHQAERVKKMFEKNIWKNVDILPDLQGIPRLVKAKLF